MSSVDLFALLEDHRDEFYVQGRALAREMQVYQFAIEEVRTKLNVLRDEISLLEDYNPIEHLTHRVKSLDSIVRKLKRKGHPVTVESMHANLFDIAGLRVICSFISDTYRLYDMLSGQPDIKILERKDYIADPKPNGYRGLHAIVETPVHLSSGLRPVCVEVQFRTIAMDFWASLEHKIYYKYEKTVPVELLDELTDAAETAHQLDRRMQMLHREIRGSRTD